MNLAQHLSARSTPQTKPIFGRTDMVENNAGGFVFGVDDFVRLNRFLVLGSEGGTYYASEKSVTVDNAKCVLRCLAADASRTIRTIVEISDAGRAPKNTPAILALAVAMTSTDATVKALVAEAIPKVCRTGTHIIEFAKFCKELRGFGTGLRRAINGWYEGQTVDQLAYQVAKYQSRDGWSHRDTIRLTHPQTADPYRQAVYRWITSGVDIGDRTFNRKRNGVVREASYAATAPLPAIIEAFEEAKTADEKRVVQLIREANLPRECIPTSHLNSVAVWEALLEKMPLTALVRNLGKMTSIGLVKPLSDAAKAVREKLSDEGYIRKSRLHPLAILVALKTYGSGHGLKGSLTWSPVQTVVDGLDAAFYSAFGNVEPANKNTMLALDVSGSMGFNNIAGLPITPREASAAFAMVLAKTEPDHLIMAFSTQFMQLDFSSCSRLSDVLAKVDGLPFSGTDCSIPMMCAHDMKLNVDTFVTITDNETYAGRMHPTQALKRYRDGQGKPKACSVVVGMTATEFTIADPTDPLTMDVVGFDTAAPQLITDFSAGRI